MVTNEGTSLNTTEAVAALIHQSSRATRFQARCTLNYESDPNYDSDLDSDYEYTSHTKYRGSSQFSSHRNPLPLLECAGTLNPSNDDISSDDFVTMPPLLNRTAGYASDSSFSEEGSDSDTDSDFNLACICKYQASYMQLGTNTVKRKPFVSSSTRGHLLQRRGSRKLLNITMRTTMPEPE